MGHAAANFQQYEAYGYPPNFPPTLRKMPPQTKVLINFFASNIFIFHTIYMIFFCVLGGNYWERADGLPSNQEQHFGHYGKN